MRNGTIARQVAWRPKGAYYGVIALICAGFCGVLLSPALAADTADTSSVSRSIEAVTAHAIANDDSADINVLSADDVALYREIFALQERGAWPQADAKIARISDKALLGYVQHQRYMHPTKYRSKYGELRKWMSQYADHPQAHEIYRLALRRRPKRSSPPVRPTPRKWRTGEETPLHPLIKADYDKTSRSRLRRLEGRVRYLCRKEQAMRALNEITRERKARRITERQFDRMRSWVAASLYYQGYVGKATSIAQSAAKRSGDSAVLAYWIAGLIAYRQGDMTQADEYFSLGHIPLAIGPRLTNISAPWPPSSIRKTPCAPPPVSGPPGPP